MEYYSAIKNNEILIWSNMDKPRDYILSEVNQTEKAKYHMISLSI